MDGGAEERLTSAGYDDGPEYSPDGKHIWFNSVRSGLMQVWRMETDGANPTHMVNEEANGWFPHVSPDNQWVVYIAYKKGDVDPGDHPANKHVELRLIPATGGESKTIVSLFGGQGTINVNSWAPDSKRFAYYGINDEEAGRAVTKAKQPALLVNGTPVRRAPPAGWWRSDERGPGSSE